jgi:hypothetical protein
MANASDDLGMNHPDEGTATDSVLRGDVGSWRGFRVRTLLLLMPAVALVCWLYMLIIQSGVGFVPIGIKILIPLSITVLDDATGLPIPGARVYQPHLHPEWRGRLEMTDSDLMRMSYPDAVLQPSAVTGDDGLPIAHLGAMGSKERRLGHAFFGLVPILGEPEIYLFPASGIRVAAAGYETWTAFLDDIAKESGRPLVNGVPLPIEVRLKRSPPHP